MKLGPVTRFTVALLVVSGSIPLDEALGRPAGSEPVEIFRGNPNRAEVALTFDCGPWVEPSYINAILDALDEYEARVTFFVTGAFIQKHGELFESRIAPRHEIANHSYSHPNFTSMTSQAIRDELARTEELAEQYGASTLGMWRAPFGARTPRVVYTAAGEGYPVHVMWSVDSADWRTDVPAAMVKSRILRGAANGAVIVEHCNSPQTAEVLPDILWQLREWGIGVVTVSEVIAE